MRGGLNTSQALLAERVPTLDVENRRHACQPVARTAHHFSHHRSIALPTQLDVPQDVDLTKPRLDGLRRLRPPVEHGLEVLAKRAVGHPAHGRRLLLRRLLRLLLLRLLRLLLLLLVLLLLLPSSVTMLEPAIVC